MHHQRALHCRITPRRGRLLLFAGTAAFALAGVPVTHPLGAQSRDPVVDAQSLFDSRQSAATVTAMLRREHARTIDQSATILRTVGYLSQDMLPALRSEFSAALSTLYRALLQAGFPARTVADAFTANRIELDCIDPQGYPVPCGSFGGTFDAAVTGRVTWSPKPEGQTNAELRITATNLPPVTVRLGPYTLTQLSSIASQVVVRLPGSPVTGDLRLVRKSDSVTGLLQHDYRVVSPPLPWSTFGAAAINGAGAEMKHWMQGARITGGCVVNGALATAPVGTFTSATGFGGAVKENLLAVGAPGAIADAWDAAFRSAFTSYTSLVTIPALPLYPTLVSVGAAQAPPVANSATPLGSLVSVGAVSMQASALAPSVTASLVPVSVDDTARTSAISGFASVVGARFNLLLLKSLVTQLMGSGPVPKYAPPAVPLAPVEGGSCSGTGIVMVPADIW